MLYDELLQVYKSLGIPPKQIPDNLICKECRHFNNLKVKPLPAWQAGDNFANDKYKILFVGKTAREKPEEEIEDARRTASNLYWEHWPYWSYTREILRRIYDEEGDAKEEAETRGWDSFAFTNIVKCSKSDTVDNTTDSMKENCINKLGVIWKEIEFLKPKNIIFYTGQDYDDYMEDFGNQTENRRIVNINDKENKVMVGRKYIVWWEREIYVDDKLTMRILRTAHPERKKKEEFVSKIVKWICQRAIE